MADNTRMKELQAKVETLFTLMDHNEQRFKTIEQSLTTLPMIQQSLAGISQMLESTQIRKHSGESSTTPTLVDEASQITVQPSLDAYSVRNIKIDFPRFGGIDALNWIFQAEQFFEYYGVPDQHRLRIASVHFDGPVVPWYQRLQKAGKLTSWGNLTKSLECTYGPPVFESPRYSLFRLTQESTVAEFYAHITVLANRVNGVPEDVLMDCFIGGLKKELQAEVIPWDPDDLDKAVTLAKLFDEKLQFGKKASFSRNVYIPDTKIKPFSAIAPTVTHTSTGNSTLPTTFRKMGFQEMQIRKSKGLCFTCDDKYSPTHKCPNKKLLLLQWDDNGTEIYDNEFFIDPHPPDAAQDTSTDSSTKMSLNAMSSTTISGTMHFTGNLGGQKITILLDGGSDDTFIQPRVVKFFHMDVLPTLPLKVLVGNGQTLKVEGKIPELVVQVQGYTLLVPAYVLPIAGADLILGASWLAKLGPHVVDYEKKIIKFYHNNQFMVLKGEPVQRPAYTTVSQLHRLCSTQAVWECYSLQIIQENSQQNTLASTSPSIAYEIQSVISVNAPLELLDLLLKFQTVFSCTYGFTTIASL